MIRTVIIVWVFTGVIAAILWLYWCRYALDGKFGHKAQTQIATALAMANGWRVLGPLAVLVAVMAPFVILPIALYGYANYGIAKITSRD